MGDLLIRRKTNADPEFYLLLGPFLSRRAIVAEIGNPVWDDDGKQWWVARDGEGAVVGFAAAWPVAGSIRFGSDYVVPAARCQGVGAALLRARLDAYPDRRITVTTNANSRSLYEQAGFVAGRVNGRFVSMVREGTSA